MINSYCSAKRFAKEISLSFTLRLPTKLLREIFTSNILFLFLLFRIDEVVPQFISCIKAYSIHIKYDITSTLHVLVSLLCTHHTLVVKSNIIFSKCLTCDHDLNLVHMYMCINVCMCVLFIYNST